MLFTSRLQHLTTLFCRAHGFIPSATTRSFSLQVVEWHTVSNRATVLRCAREVSFFPFSVGSGRSLGFTSFSFAFLSFGLDDVDAQDEGEWLPVSVVYLSLTFCET